jgi:hypothetical protein
MSTGYRERQILKESYTCDWCGGSTEYVAHVRYQLQKGTGRHICRLMDPRHLEWVEGHDKPKRLQKTKR